VHAITARFSEEIGRTVDDRRLLSRGVVLAHQGANGRRARLGRCSARIQEAHVKHRRSEMISKVAVCLALAACVISVQPAAAQSTIFNIPSTDTVSPGKGYFEFDYLAQLPKPDVGQFQVFAPRGIVGVTPQLEVGINVAVTHVSDGGGNTTIVQPNAKYKFFADDDRGLAAAAGIIGYLPNNDGDKFGQIYGDISKKVKSGARFTAGVYGAMSCDFCNGSANKAGAILGYEQPITPKVSFVADWLSGKNFWGYFTPGVSVILPHSGLLNIGYSIGNDSFKNNDLKNRALFVYYGITFP
jgi:hypothetical protein